MPVLERMGARVALSLESYGFYPAGGGRFTVTVTSSPLSLLSLVEVAEPAIHVGASVASLPN